MEENLMPQLQHDEYIEVAWCVENCGDEVKPMWINRGNCGTYRQSTRACEN